MALQYAIIETASGLSVVPLPSGASSEETAAKYGGVIVDAGPYPTYQEAYDALQTLADEEDEADYD